MSKKKQGMHLLTSIVDRGCGTKLTQYYIEKTLICHTHCVGSGTASSYMLDMLGIDTPEKDVIFSIGPANLVHDIMQEISNNKAAGKVKGGILFSSKLTALNGMVATILQKAATIEEDNEVKYMETNTANTLIMVTINQGYTDEMMQVARSAGAAGGTIIRGRWADGGEMEKLHGMSVQEEREIVFILASNAKRKEIIEAINQDFGITSEAHGIISATAVEYSTKI